MLVKVAALEALLVSLVAAGGGGLDGTAERVVLYGAAATALLWFWAKLLRPAARLIARTIRAVEAFESLPKWRDEIDERMAEFEGELGTRARQMDRIENGQAAILRELGIEDKVRRIPPQVFGVDPDDPAV